MSTPVNCETCFRESLLLRSVMIRRWKEGPMRRYPDPAASAEAAQAWSLHELEMQFRRMLICNQCYKILDGWSGTGLITDVDGVARLWNMSCSTRGRKAKVYGFKKYKAYRVKNPLLVNYLLDQ